MQRTGKQNSIPVILFFSLAAATYCLMREVSSEPSSLKSSAIRHGARRQAILQYPGFPQGPTRSKNHVSAEKLLSSGQRDTLDSIQKIAEPSEAISIQSNVNTNIPVQGLDPSAHLWNAGLFENIVQMTQNGKLFKEMLEDTKMRVRRMLQDDTGLLAHLESMGLDGRIKTPESITRKILFKANRQKKKEVLGDPDDGKQAHINKVYDVVGLRIVVDSSPLPGESPEDREARSVRMCYRVKNLILKNWETIPFREKDYIMKPKGNGYQSLHLTVVANYHLTKIPVEFQIRTAKMDHHANNGPAAHNRYKEHFMDDLLANSFPVNAPPSESSELKAAIIIDEKKAKKKQKRRLPRCKKAMDATKGRKAKANKSRRTSKELEELEELVVETDWLVGVEDKVNVLQM
eukprot:CAMPEP_0184482482 /NCGR_PEP_ID=MMETSP0113_2-20130426/4040_1 /TAXON_ID=91329 /ORGANISM="Norrisiella sphaerica, Strain BC52" /LENGTH=403 /DNA_ID=CAMNT_0026862233 /DNA_START=132 /DNA_END=1343 /DNA_ORIENTATION=-